jgi:hexosaminidase
MGTQTASVALTFHIHTTSSSPILRQAIERYQALLFPFGGPHFAHDHKHTLTSLEVQVAADLETLRLGMDESYRLDVDSPVAKLIAPTIWGAMRGLETFSQLVSPDWHQNASTTHHHRQKLFSYSLTHLPLSIEDQPRFPWRGLLLDTSRHYLPVSVIKRTLDAMAYNKLNTLHWHLVDSQAFPFASVRFPRLSMGALHPDAVYTHADIREVVAFARERGIRVVPEVDMPGHTASWGVGYPEIMAPSILCPLNPPIPHDVLSGHDPLITAELRVSLDPTKNLTYVVIQGLLEELTELFEDPYFHVGGDEVKYDCWSQNHQLSAWMRENGIPSPKDLQSFFEVKVAEILNKLKRTGIFWQDAPFAALPTDSVIQFWKNSQINSALDKGFKVLYSFGNFLDVVLPQSILELRRNFMDLWINYYVNDPSGLTVETKIVTASAAGIVGPRVLPARPQKLTARPKQTTPAPVVPPVSRSGDHQNLLGGEALMWGEGVDQSNIDSQIWPSGSAVAERLWSARTVTDIADARIRIEAFRCRSLARRGIRAAPVSPGFCALPHYYHHKISD